MKNVANGLYWLSRRSPPQSNYALGTVVNFLRKHLEIRVENCVSHVNMDTLPELDDDIHGDAVFHLCHLKNQYGFNHHVVCVYRGYIFDSEHQHAIPYATTTCIPVGTTSLGQCIFLLLVALL